MIELDGGAMAHELVRVKEEDVVAWDAEHDVTGRLVHRRIHAGGEQEEAQAGAQKEARTEVQKS